MPTPNEETQENVQAVEDDNTNIEEQLEVDDGVRHMVPFTEKELWVLYGFLHGSKPRSPLDLQVLGNAKAVIIRAVGDATSAETEAELKEIWAKADERPRLANDESRLRYE